MQVPAMPDNEAARLRSLRNMLLLDTPDEEQFDRITRIAQVLFDTPIALVSLIDHDRQWFKSCLGLDVTETSREISFCGHAILGDDIFLVEDALADPRFADNPLVAGPPDIRFYAGYPLSNAEGFNIGTLCIIDRKSRHFQPWEVARLNDLGALTELVLNHRQLAASQTTLLAELDLARHAGLVDARLRIWNSRAIQDILDREIAATREAGQVLMVAKLHSHDYRLLNEQDGADAADSMLLELLRQLRRSLPEALQSGRIQDDQILLVWRGESVEACEEVAEHLGRQLANLSLGPPWSDLLGSTDNSLGIVIHAATTAEMLSRIDLLTAVDHCTDTARHQEGARHAKITL